MPTRNQIMQDFARKRGLLCTHRKSSAIVELVPRCVEPDDADLSLYADLGSAVSADWIIHEIDLDPEKSPPPEPYIGDAVRHWQRIQTMQKMLIAPGIDGVEEIEAVPAGWLAVMETHLVTGHAGPAHTKPRAVSRTALSAKNVVCLFRR